MKDYTTGPSIFETAQSEIRSVPAGAPANGQDEPLRWTIAPWKIALDRDGNPTKILALSRKICSYEYGTTTWDYSSDDAAYWWLKGLRVLPRHLSAAMQEWLRGRICSRKSGLIVVDVDARDLAPGFFQSTGIPESPYRVSTWRGDHYYYNGRGLAPDDFPVHGPVSCGDIISAGFVPEPGCPHPKGGRYELPSAGKLPKWLPEYTGGVRADREAMGRHGGGSYEHTEGPGRNNELYRLKRELFFGHGLDEDDPELARRIFAFNQTFTVPLSKAEVNATVLKIKGWARRSARQQVSAALGHEGGGPEDVPAGQEGKQVGRPRAEVRELETAEPESEPPATPGIVAPIGEGGSSIGATTGFPDGSRRACEDLIRDPVLVRELLRDSWDETGRKLGEGNDWDGSPRLCHEAYDHHLLRWADGADIRVADMEPAHVRWLERPGLFVGSRVKPKYVQFIRLEGDLVVPQDTALKDPGPEYPGWDDETQQPCEGRRCGWRTRAAVLEAVQSGKAVDRPAICELLNTKACREANRELDLCGCKGFKRKQIDKCVERLIHDGELYVVEEAVQYWRNRCWNTVPAVLAVPEVPEELPAAPELDGEDEPTEKNRIVAVWYRQQVKKFCRAARNKRGRQQERGTPQGEGTGRPAMQGRERDPVQRAQGPRHRRPASP